MKVLDLDMDYFMKSVATFINESEPERLPEEDYHPNASPSKIIAE